ncbi:MAG: AEC family transporter [Bacillota bacterium]
MDNFTVINQVVILFMLMAVGFYAEKKDIINYELSKGLSDILINIALPALIISSFTFKFSKDMLENAGIVIIFSLFIHTIVILLSRLAFKNYAFNKRNVLNYFAVFPNAAFMGLPFIFAIYGQTGVFYASIFLVPNQVLMWTYGQGMFLKEAGEQLKLKPFLTKLKNPAILGVAIGLIIFILSIKLPYTIDKTLTILGGITLPLAMMIVGEKIAKVRLKDIFSDKDVYYGSFVRLIIVPIMTFVFLRIFNVNPLIINVCVAVEVLPAATTVVILSQQYGGDSVFASKCALISHLLSIITIPIMIIFLKVI